MIQWFSWFDRGRITLAIGAISLALGAWFPWYQLPPEALQSFSTSLWLTTVGRIGSALFAMLAVCLIALNSNRKLRLLFWAGLTIVLLVPYLITTWSPTVTFLADAYYDQQQRVAQHVEATFPQLQAQWQQNVLLPSPKPPPSSLRFSIKNSRFFQIPSWDRILMAGLGYSNDFLGFIGRGWPLTAVGLVISLFALYLKLGDKNLGLLLADLRQLAPYLLLGCCILVISLVTPNIVNYQLDTLLVKGQYRSVITGSQTLANWYKPFQGDATFLSRLATARFYSGEPDSALTYFAQGLEMFRLQNFRRAELYFRQSLEIQPSLFVARGYLATSLLNQGVISFNDLSDPFNHRAGAAIDYFTQALQVFPGHVEALYDLMLAQTANGEFENMALTAQQIIKSQDYPQQPQLGLLGQAYLRLSWASYRDGDPQDAWQRYRQSIDPKTWKKAIKGVK
jgi:tetratricopeptide (TPR) repeat protein